MKYFFERLKEERNRLGLNQEEFAALGGVKKGAQFNYENGSRKPDSDYLEAIALAGVDVLYLLTGKTSNNTLADDENELLVGYRNLDVRGKAGVLGMIGGMSAPPAQRNQSVVFHGAIGQQVTGDITAPTTITVESKKKKKI